MILNIEDFKRMFLKSCELLEDNVDTLSEIDSKFGDGDHGVTIGKISGVIRESIVNHNEDSIKGFLEIMGDKIMNVNGGSAGPLWGTFIVGLSEGIEEEKEINEENLKDMLLASLINMQLITKAKVGDKTMMDVLIPVVNGARYSKEKLPELLRDIAASAAKGAEDSKNYVAKFGRARFYKEQTLGYMDAGAMSLSLLFKGWAEALGV
ncbi:dihydroxyacetone kinase subunit L [Clostridium sp.]|uniref:dihydroxyacetone kinase subunit L n=1 Tax=Clostridium sp. TaxID=1506 RepID=UPI003217CF42